jgi:imidazole glycerol phosphate synthase subunit HisF
MPASRMKIGLISGSRPAGGGAGIFHFGEYTVADVKQYLAKIGMLMRTS